MSDGLGKRIVNVLYNLDRAVNSAWGGRRDESISGTVGRAAEAGKWWAVDIAQPVINAIMFLQPNHCQVAAADEGATRAALPGDADA